MLISPNSNSFTFLCFQFHYYGIIIAFAVIISIFVLKFLVKKVNKGVNFDVIIDVLPVLILGAVLGARFYYVLLNFDYYSSNFWEIFKVWHGGMAIHGAILAGILILLFYHLKKIINFSVFADAIACVLPLGQAIGRWGNFFNQEAFGSPCNYFWCMYIEPKFRTYNYLSYDYFHPTFLYESLYNLILFVVLFICYLKFQKLPNGFFFLSYLMFYSLGRFFIELVRIDATNHLFGLPFPAVISVFVFFVALIMLIFLFDKSGKFIF